MFDRDFGFLAIDVASALAACHEKRGGLAVGEARDEFFHLLVPHEVSSYIQEILNIHECAFHSCDAVSYLAHSTHELLNSGGASILRARPA